MVASSRAAGAKRIHAVISRPNDGRWRQIWCDPMPRQRVRIRQLASVLQLHIPDRDHGVCATMASTFPAMQHRGSTDRYWRHEWMVPGDAHGIVTAVSSFTIGPIAAIIEAPAGPLTKKGRRVRR